MAEWIRSSLDLVLILMVGAGLVQALRLIRHLAGLRQGRIEMERFVRDFNSTVIRAEAGIKGLRQAARESGDDLERLVSKANMVRDELHFITESADALAERLSQSASQVSRPPTPKSDVKPETQEVPETSSVAALAGKKAESKESSAPPSRAEKELLQALQKLS